MNQTKIKSNQISEQTVNYRAHGERTPSSPRMRREKREEKVIAIRGQVRRIGGNN